MSTPRLTRTAAKASGQVPTLTEWPLVEALPEAASLVSEKAGWSGDDLAELKKMMSQLLESVTAIDRRVRAVEGGSEKRLSLINDSDKAPKTPSKQSVDTNTTTSWRLWNQQMVRAMLRAPPSSRLESLLQPPQETRWAVVNINNLSTFKGELNEDVIAFLDEMEEASNQGGWSDDELVRRSTGTSST